MNDPFPHAPCRPHGQRFLASQRRLLLAFVSQLLFFGVELLAGLLTNSLALIADAGHMFGDVAALGLSLLALLYARKPHTSEKTFGYHRLEILAALVNGLALWALAAYILYTAYGRLSAAPPIPSLPLLIIAALGLAVNLFGVVVLHPAREHNLNLRSAFLHLVADSLGSVAAIGAGLAIHFKGWFWFDPLAGGVIAVLILISSWRLVKEAADILMEATPRHIDLDEVAAALRSHAGVEEIHDLHIWSISSGFYSLSVHVVLSDSRNRDRLTWELEDLLSQRFGLEHTTIQLEGPDYPNPRVCTLQGPH
ncbi:MAG: cation diffusion facilitator family transporter [Desulfobaccales bacterium]